MAFKICILVWYILQIKGIAHTHLILISFILVHLILQQLLLSLDWDSVFIPMSSPFLEVRKVQRIMFS